MQIALVCLVLIQLAIAGGCGLLYARMRSKADAEKASMVPWGIEVKAAVGTAQSAKDMVDKIELEHFKNLRSMFESQVLQIAQLKADIAGLQQQVDSLTTKVLSLQRMDRHAVKREADRALAEEVEPASPGPEMNGVPFPGGSLTAPRRNSFGRIP